MVGNSKEKFEQKYAKKIEGDIGSLWSLKEDSNPSTMAQHTADVPSTRSISPSEEKVKHSSDFSLKGGIQNPSKWTKEFLDTIEDVRDGKKSAESRLYKYVEDGTLSTKDYDELVEKYGAIPKGEKPHRDVQVPKNSANGKKVSQTVRTILEANIYRLGYRC